MIRFIYNNLSSILGQEKAFVFVPVWESEKAGVEQFYYQQEMRSATEKE
jgi:hypothetical protein